MCNYSQSQKAQFWIIPRQLCSAGSVLMLLTFAPLALAQTDAGDVNPPSTAPLEELQPRPLPPPEELFSPPSAPEAVSEAEIPRTLTINAFRVVGSTVFSDEELTALLVPYTNRPLRFSELLQARNAITNYYLRQGYVTSGAILPPQKLTEGIVTIQVIEGKVEEIVVKVEGRLNPDYIRDRAALAAKTPLQIDELQSALQLLELDPGIASISAELSATPEVGKNLLTIQVETADTFALDLLVDNGRSPSVGTVRRQASLTESNLLGYGDEAFLSYTNTDGSDAFEVSYRLPVNPRHGNLSFAYGRTHSEVIEDPFTPLDIQSDYRYYEISFYQPVILTPTQELTLGITASRQESENFLFEDQPFPLSVGSDAEGETRITALRFSQEWIQRGENEVFAARSQFSVGVDWLDGTVNENAPDTRFFAWRGQGQWVRRLAEDALILIRSDLQLASQSLPPLEQFGSGGLGSVRGYRQDALLSDNGWLASAEVRLPILRVDDWDSVLQVTPFVDLGIAWNNERNGENRPQLDSNVLTGVGLGVRWQTGDHLTARFDWGIPLVDIDDRDETLQEQGLYFSVLYAPF
ncbi:surface antigen (D15) [Halothece sp. PCC 7418]|uniref:ShlB/FhaC/HecB family hemolysin secretion/activation protein n=1 Tax=Halothece sp. (strain PCC 7418) TaxID=65093 RepID=UPI0002A06602|nr:ShlB/FhaC/HecB family hemolysin secretion/activation protein [Halothece sp. PCC 7418]AFZ42843.1 surface antigen (D15) [Halothece sp. PCC 7418]